jgi:hypothetical protein
MKSTTRYLPVAITTTMILIGYSSCKKEFLEPQPYGRYSLEQLQSKKGKKEF